MVLDEFPGEGFCLKVSQLSFCCCRRASGEWLVGCTCHLPLATSHSPLAISPAGILDVCICIIKIPKKGTRHPVRNRDFRGQSKHIVFKRSGNRIVHTIILAKKHPYFICAVQIDFIVIGCRSNQVSLCIIGISVCAERNIRVRGFFIISR